MGGKLILFCSYAPGAGKTCEMLRYAECLEKNGHNCFPLYLDIKGRDYEKDNLFFKRYLAEKGSRRNAESSEWIILDELGLRNEKTKKYICQEADEFLNKGTNVLSCCNMQVFENYSILFRDILKIRNNRVISEKYLDIAEKIYFIDRNPERIVEEYKAGCLFRNNNHILEKYMDDNLLNKYRQKVISNLMAQFSEKVEVIS